MNICPFTIPWTRKKENVMENILKYVVFLLSLRPLWFMAYQVFEKWSGCLLKNRTWHHFPRQVCIYSLAQHSVLAVQAIFLRFKNISTSIFSSQHLHNLPVHILTVIVKDVHFSFLCITRSACHRSGALSYSDSRLLYPLSYFSLGGGVARSCVLLHSFITGFSRLVRKH